jgi:hypothetical protein
VSKATHSKWTYYCVCSKCDEALTRNTIYNHGGICPHCGYDDDSTICAYKNIIRRKVYTPSNARREAIKAQKLREAGYFSTEFLRQSLAALLAKRKPRQFTWEYKDAS